MARCVFAPRSFAVLVLLLAAGGSSGCDNRVKTFAPVALRGLPLCDETAGRNMLRTPLVFELRNGRDFHRVVHLGGGLETLPVNHERNERSWTLKMGECTKEAREQPSISYDCGEPHWYAEKKVVLDPRVPEKAVLTIDPPPRRAPCWRGDARP